MAFAVPLICLARRRDPRAVPRPPARVPRGDRALRPRRLSPACRCRRRSRRRFVAALVRHPRRPRHSTARRRTSACARRRPAGSLAADQRDAPPVLTRARSRPRRALRRRLHARQPRTKFERPLAAMAIGCTVLFIGQAAMVSTAEAHRPLERYLFYSRRSSSSPSSPTWNEAHRAGSCTSRCGLAGALALSRCVAPRPDRHDGVLLRLDHAHRLLARRLPDPKPHERRAPVRARPTGARSPGLGAPTAAQRRRRALRGPGDRRSRLATGIGVYATDSLATSWAARTYGSTPMNWLDESKLGPARYLALPRSNIFARASLEILEPGDHGRRRPRHRRAGPPARSASRGSAPTARSRSTDTRPRRRRSS